VWTCAKAIDDLMVSGCDGVMSIKRVFSCLVV
jgi:hypothetical protein